VETLRESEDTRVDASDAGTEVAKVFPSKTIVGLVAVVALAEEGIAIRLAIAKSPVRTIEMVLCDCDITLEFIAIDIRFPSLVHLVFLKLTLGLGHSIGS